MKYIVVCFIILILSGWYWLGLENAKHSQQVKVYGKVTSLQGELVLNIKDSHLRLSAYDRFTFIAYATTAEQLTITVSEQPKDQTCELLTSNTALNTMHLNISCENTEQVIIKNETAIL